MTHLLYMAHTPFYASDTKGYREKPYTISVEPHLGLVGWVVKAPSL